MSYQEYRATARFPALDGLRAIAVMLVLAEHYGGARWTWVTGWLGVQLFFVISGFLITTLLLREYASKGSVSLRSFYIRRVFRIVPVYLVVLLVTCAVFWREGSHQWELLRSAVPWYLLFLNEFAEGPWRLTWTIGIEWKFYMLWAPFAFVLCHQWWMRLVGAVVLLVAAYIYWDHPASENLYWYAAYSSLGYYGVIMMGCVLALILHNRYGFALLRPLMYPPVSLAILAAFLALQATSQEILAKEGLLRVVYLYGFASAILIAAVVGKGSAAFLLSTFPMRWIGERSYSLYLVQIVIYQVILQQYGVLFPGTIALIVMAILGLALSDVLYRFVEKPMIRLGHQIIVGSRPVAIVTA